MGYHHINSLKRTFSVHIYFFKAITLACLFVSCPILAENTNSTKIKQLNTRFQTLSSQIYDDYTNKQKTLIKSIDDIKRLQQKIRNLAIQLNYISAVSHIKINLQTIKNNIYDKSVLYFLEFLLEQNEWKTANELYAEIQYEDDRFLVSNATYLLAKYYFKRSEWEKSIKLLSNISEELSVDNTHHAHVIHGIALQRLKKHRKAAKLYEKIPTTSKYYIYAQLNLAIAFIRQGWWTDAHIIINKLLKNGSVNKSEEMTNRLYLVLGYSLLNKEYYRDAREAFRNIGLDSQYTNRALLGIALTAANQSDHVGALNALSILKNKKALELSVDESYLLLPYVYEKLGQQVTASAGYTEAIKYYQTRITDIQSTLNNGTKDYIDDALRVSANTLLIDGNTIEFRENESEIFLTSLYKINSLQRISTNPQIKQNIAQLQKEYSLSLDEIIKSSLQEKIRFLDSYLNQARYGLARLYDSSISEK